MSEREPDPEVPEGEPDSMPEEWPEDPPEDGGVEVDLDPDK